MSDLGQQTEQRTCGFPGCERPAATAEAGTGRPPEYCDDPGHNRAAAWRARRRLGSEPARSVEDEKRPVDAARQRASEIRAQVAGMVEHLGGQLNALVEELRTVADPDAAEAQIESVTTEAAEQVAAASVRASRAEKAQRQAEAERAEADAAAVEASELADQERASLVEVREQLTLQGEALDQVTAELAETRTAGETRDRQAQAEAAELREQLAAVQVRLAETEQARAAAILRAEEASAARAEADERARGAIARADTEADRTRRAEADLSGVREQLDQVRTEREELRGKVATVTVEREAARAEADREREHGNQRVADLHTNHDQQLSVLRAELAEARQDAREQRSRADKADTTSSPRAATTKGSARSTTGETPTK